MALGGALGPGLGACDAAALCVAGVAQPEIHLRFTWQAWHKLASTVVLRGRRGTYGTPGLLLPSFTWQAWHFTYQTIESPSLFCKASCRSAAQGSTTREPVTLALIEQLNETIVCFVVNLDCRMSPHRLRIRMSLWHRAHTPTQYNNFTHSRNTITSHTHTQT